LKRDIFRRDFRGSIPFGPLENRDDPLGTGNFEFNYPRRVDTLRSGPQEIQTYGEHQYRPQSSPICKPNGGCASTDGPMPDYAQGAGILFPMGTKPRIGPLKTAKTVK
jgi:hypothetical protein